MTEWLRWLVVDLIRAAIHISKDKECPISETFSKLEYFIRTREQQTLDNLSRMMSYASDNINAGVLQLDDLEVICEKTTSVHLTPYTAWTMILDFDFDEVLERLGNSGKLDLRVFRWALWSICVDFMISKKNEDRALSWLSAHEHHPNQFIQSLLILMLFGDLVVQGEISLDLINDTVQACQDSILQDIIH